VQADPGLIAGAPAARAARSDDDSEDAPRAVATDARPPAAGAPPDRSRNAGAAEEMPRVRITRRQAVVFGVFILSAVGFLYFVLPQLAGLGGTVHRIEGGNTWWIAVGVVFEMLSFAGYIALFRTVFVRDAPSGEAVGGVAPGPVGPGGVEVGKAAHAADREAEGERAGAEEPGGHVSGAPNGVARTSAIGWRESYQVTMASLVATRLFAAAGAGGIALTVWALRRSGMEARLVACRMVAFMVLLYVIYAGSLLLDGIGLASGIFPGGGSLAITIVPATVAALLFALAGAMALLPGDIERRLQSWAKRSGRLAHWIARAATVPALAASGVRTAIALVRSRELGLLGAPAWWGFDICVLWAAFHAFGSAPPFTVIWMAYFVGTLGNLLPLPGGLGGVEGGMIGAFAAFGVNIDLAVLAVLTYRGISFWLPTIPGAIAYFQLLRTVNRWEERARGEIDAVPAA
jgi:uncharacterized protein (TIRG00374 family)